MRTPLIAGNWKLNKTIQETRAYLQEFASLVASSHAAVEVLLCPVFTALSAASEATQNTNIKIGAQDFYWKNSGAYTGEVSLPLLKDAGVTHVLIGHSERRGRFGVPEPDLEGAAAHVFGDTDQSVNKKLQAALAANVTPIVCVGETLVERKNGHTDTVVSSQVALALENISAQGSDLVFAYEPVWAIGTGETCDASEANRVCGVIRASVALALGVEAGEQVRVQYGGSVKPDNARELLSQEHIDGALVGGASLKPGDFAQIVMAA